MKNKVSVIQAVHQIGRLVFTTREIAALTNSSMTSATQCLNRLAEKGIIRKIMQGLWGMTVDRRFSPFLVIPFLNPNHRFYLSFISALHIYGVVSQIPHVITVASTAHSKKVHTSVGTFEIHQISPDFFCGFDWHNQDDYLIATPEKAMVDCLYIASRKKRQFAHFPELDLSRIKRKLVLEWAGKIKNDRIKISVTARAERLSY